ncbi:hypothetical protein KSP39_PZI009869 [Platanthera zijinensis]
MDKYFKVLPKSGSHICEKNDSERLQLDAKRAKKEVNIDNRASDPGLRCRISDYPINDRDDVRRYYLLKGPCQPKTHEFPRTIIGNISRKFNPAWFEHFPSWLEYSIEKDAAFCLFCYLFKQEMGQQSGGDSFVIDGFKNWKKGFAKFKEHVGGPTSIHNRAVILCNNLMDSRQHIDTSFHKQTDQAKEDYRTRLTATINCIRFLIRQGLALRGNDESDASLNQGNFLELLRFLGNHNESISKVILQNAPENHKLTAPDIQKDIINAMAVETTSLIIKDIGENFFSILLDESRDISTKEQMAIALRYVDRTGQVIERFVGIVHVSDTSAQSLKLALLQFFSEHGLSITRIRGQGYDGASNMRGEFNGLKTLIMNENSSAYYVHCFAHQLQLALVAVAKSNVQVAWLFDMVSAVTNIITVSCKRQELLHVSQFTKIIEGLQSGELSGGTGINQMRNLKRAGDTRWGSHFGSLLSLIGLFSSVIDVLEIVQNDRHSSSEQKASTFALLDVIQTFDFVIILFLMKNILGITNSLSQSLQRKDLDIVNAMNLVRISKQLLQNMRDEGWENLLKQVSAFCCKYKIDIPDMDTLYIARGRSRRRVHEMTNIHYYRAELYYVVIDTQLQELNNRFTEITTELLLCMTCLSPMDSFSLFDKQKLIRLAEFYPFEFSRIDLIELESQLDTYILDVRSDNDLSDISGIDELAKKLIEKRKNIIYPLVYLLVNLVLVLPVATATVERAFSAMKIVKNRLRNRMGDSLMNDCLVTYIEKDIFDSIENETIIQRFQNMKSRRGQL